MKIDGLNYEIFINDISDHLSHKKNLLDLIAQLPKNSFDNVSNTDWYENQGIFVKQNSAYYNYFLEYILPIPYKKLANYLHADDYDITNGWFQQYEKGDEHCWHNHNGANYTNIYFLELPDTNFATQLYDNHNKKILDLEVREGSLLTFPASVLHRSKKNTGKRKTIISFNSDFKFNNNMNL